MIATIVIVAYMLGIVLTARWRYQDLRPFTEPITCDSRSLCERTYHSSSCYRQYGMIDTTGEAIACALLQSLIWPLLLAWSGFGAICGRGILSFITSAARPTMAELEAKNARLERELGITDR